MFFFDSKTLFFNISERYQGDGKISQIFKKINNTAAFKTPHWLNFLEAKFLRLRLYIIGQQAAQPAKMTTARINQLRDPHWKQLRKSENMNIASTGNCQTVKLYSAGRIEDFLIKFSMMYKSILKTVDLKKKQSSERTNQSIVAFK